MGAAISSYLHREPPRLRGHRVQSVQLTQAELVEIRARQRTFEAAYWRTSLGQFAFALVVLKIFQAEFYPIGVLYTVFGFLMILVAAVRRTRSNLDFFEDGHGRYFRTSGRIVLITSVLAMCLYINLVVLIMTE